MCRLQEDREAERFIIYRRWTVQSIALGKHTAQNSSLFDINESWRWQWPWEVIYLIHPVLLHRSVSSRHLWAEQACLSCAGGDPGKEGLQSPLVLLATDHLVILSGFSTHYSRAGLILFIAAWLLEHFQSLNFSVCWRKKQSWALTK